MAIILNPAADVELARAYDVKPALSSLALGQWARRDDANKGAALFIHNFVRALAFVVRRRCYLRPTQLFRARDSHLCVEV
jgi:hypothetical protein